MSISFRLKHVASLVTEGYVVADIGTDHGYVPIYLLQNERVPRAIAVDVCKGPLERAQINAEKADLTDRMECRLSDGLEKVAPGEADSIVICGMGGILMRRILEDGKATALSARELILSPHRDPELIVEFLNENGFTIVYDDIIEDKKKKYRVIKGVK